MLETAPEIDRLVDQYIANKVMPDDADGDARHLALATFHKCDILVSWNCRHIANANKTDHIQHVNRKLLPDPDHPCRTQGLTSGAVFLELDYLGMHFTPLTTTYSGEGAIVVASSRV